MRILPNINGHDDLVRLSDQQRADLCDEIRSFLVSSVSQTGGHLASNLGTVELSVAIETVFNTMEDRLVFDVGHQSYVHKLLTGRQADFGHLRQLGGISGFPKPNESESDAFVAGHASSSVSIALGMARARTLQNKDYNVIALIGDGAATGGMAYEGLNDAAVSKEPMIVILNDNEMSIDRNVGGMAKHLSRIRSSDDYLKLKLRYRNIVKKIPGGKALYTFTSKVKNRVKRFLLQSTIFENMGLTYLGPVDGHDLHELIDLLRVARDFKSPVLIHVLTKKGFGYAPAEQDPSRFHGVGKFDPATGAALSVNSKTYSDVFGETMMDLAAENERVCAITAAMPGGTGLLKFREAYPKRLFDVGIAEEHAVSMAGGLAKQGMIPVVALYSTFLQRSYDQIIQRQIPGMTVLCPTNFEELRHMLRWAVNDCTGPVAIRYPRGNACFGTQSTFNGDPSGIYANTSLKDAVATLITYGSIAAQANAAVEKLAEKGLSVRMLTLNSVTHFSEDNLVDLVCGKHVFVVEEICSGSGISEAIAMCLQKRNLSCKIHALDLGRDFVTHGHTSGLYKQTGLDSDSIACYISEVLVHEN